MLALAAPAGALAAPAETVLHSFAGTGGSDGANPLGGLLADSSGNLYGTTEFGGASGNGVVFKLAPGGAETVLYSFCPTSGCSDGANPGAGLIADGSGNLYGTTALGGASNLGVVFKLAPGRTETVLYTFCSLPGCSDGAIPGAGVIADSSGNFYGTTEFGGGSACPSGCGVVFKLAGTGFVTAIPFSAFSGKLEIAVGKTPNTDSFHLKASFALGSKSNGINPPAEPVTLQIGKLFTTTIPSGSFKGSGAGPFTFQGTINGVALQVRIALTNSSTRQYSFKAEGSGAGLTGTAKPVPVTLTIGDDSGTVSINAEIGS